MCVGGEGGEIGDVVAGSMICGVCDVFLHLITSCLSKTFIHCSIGDHIILHVDRR